MKIIRTIIFLCIPLFCIAQHSETELLLNVACKNVVPKEFHYFNMVDSSFVMDFDKYSLDVRERENKIFLDDNPEFNPEEFIALANKAKPQSWEGLKIENAVLYSKNTIPRFPTWHRNTRLIPYNTPKRTLDSLEQNKKYDELIIRVKESWSQKKIDRVTNKAWRNYYDTIPPEKRTYFRVSTPLFSSNGKYAILQVNKAGSGACYIFQKTDGGWKQVYIFGRWIS